jgi:hypothetical protein
MNSAPFLPSLLLLPAVGYALQAWWFRREAQRSLKWRETQGMTTRSELDVKRIRRRRGADYDVYRPLVEYTYDVPGKVDRVGTRVYYGADQWRKTAGIADEICSKYRVGQPCRVYVNPGRVEESVLERGQVEGSHDALRQIPKWVFLALVWWALSKFLGVEE